MYRAESLKVFHPVWGIFLTLAHCTCEAQPCFGGNPVYHPRHQQELYLFYYIPCLSYHTNSFLVFLRALHVTEILYFRSHFKGQL